MHLRGIRAEGPWLVKLLGITIVRTLTMPLRKFERVQCDLELKKPKLVRYTLPHGDLISIHRLKRYEVEMHTL
jgi:hypothetical protein